eukprot:7384396-Prymnesium_polylepis.1
MNSPRHRLDLDKRMKVEFACKMSDLYEHSCHEPTGTWEVFGKLTSARAPRRTWVVARGSG